MYPLKKEKYYLYLTSEERRDIIQSLIEKKNTLVRAGKYTDAVDDILCKLIKASKTRVSVKYI